MSDATDLAFPVRVASILVGLGAFEALTEAALAALEGRWPSALWNGVGVLCFAVVAVRVWRAASVLKAGR